MGLITQGPAFARWSDNLATASADGKANVGAGVTPGVSSAVGSPVTLLSALAHDCEYLVLAISGLGVPANDSSALIDILVDPAGGTSWTTLIGDLLAGFTAAIDYDSTGTILGVPLSYHFPLWIPAGASLGVQARFAHSSAPADPARIVAYAAGGNKNPASWWCGQKVETVGTMSTGTSRGQAHSPGSGNVFSSWTSLGSPVGGRGGAVQWAAQCYGSSSPIGKVYRFEFGAGSAQIGPCLYKAVNAVRTSTQFPVGPVFCDIPAGTQLQVRATAGFTIPGSIDVAGYVVQ